MALLARLQQALAPAGGMQLMRQALPSLLQLRGFTASPAQQYGLEEIIPQLPKEPKEGEKVEEPIYGAPFTCSCTVHKRLVGGQVGRSAGDCLQAGQCVAGMPTQRLAPSWLGST